MQIDFSNFTFRCSSLGRIMVDPKGKSNKQKYEEALASYKKKNAEYSDLKNKDTKTAQNLYQSIEKLKIKTDELQKVKDIVNLSDSCKTHLADIHTATKYNRHEDIKSKYLEKGLQCEEDAIDQYCLIRGVYREKNKDRRNNEFIEGELDIYDDDEVTDFKVNWSIFQFGRVVSKPINPLYHWQLDGYMWLWNRNKGKLVYSLLNTPEFLLKQEEKKLLYEMPTQALYDEAVIELRRNHIYDDIPLEEKERIFHVERSEERIERIKQRVIECRKYLNDIETGKILDVLEEEEISEAA